MTVDELEMIAQLCRKHDVIVVSDEVYEWLVYPPQQHVRIGQSLSLLHVYILFILFNCLLIFFFILFNLLFRFSLIFFLQLFQGGAVVQR